MTGTVVINGSQLGANLLLLLTSGDIVPGTQPSYELCKLLYLYHPLGLKLVESPIRMAQSQKREIAIPDSPEDECRDAFEREWERLRADHIIFDTYRLARIYGISSLMTMAEGVDAMTQLDYWKLHEYKLSFNRLDPLNTAGSLVLSQDPNSTQFQHVVSVSVAGKPYHPSRSCVVMNEDPIYIQFESSAFGFTGRSVYQRALFPLKSFIQTMITDDLVSIKAGVFVAKLKQAGSIVDALMQRLAGVKRDYIKEAVIGGVLSIEIDEDIATLQLRNIDDAMGAARKDILENIASASDMPVKLLTQEAFTQGFGEGTEDAKQIAGYVDRFRNEMNPIYEFMNEIVMHRAWTPEFYKTIQDSFSDEYGDMEYKAAFMKWKNSFTAKWPSLLREPDSELIKVDDIKLKAIIAVCQVLEPMVDPDNKARLVQWVCDNFNEQKILFPDPLELDTDTLADFFEEQAAQAEQMQQQGAMGGEGGAQGGPKEPPTPKPFSAADSSEIVRRVLSALDARKSLDSLRKPSLLQARNKKKAA